MIGLGTNGGQPRADGSPMEMGIHLRWQMGEEIGFPVGGFDLYRRAQNLDLFARCGILSKTTLGMIVWVPKTPGTMLAVELSASGESRTIEGCGGTNGLGLPGEQSLRMKFEEPARHIRITLDRRTNPTPTAEAFWDSGSGEVIVAREKARRKGQEWVLNIFADRIDRLILSGENLLICEICAVLVMDGYDSGWDPLPLNDPIPIYLPITHPNWGSPHAHSPNDQAEAEARLPAALPADKQQVYADGFAEDLHDILYNLVGTYPQVLYQIHEQDASDGAVINWPGLDLLKLMALDPNIARILGLYWHDVPPDPDQTYDYRLVAHYGQQPFPGRHFQFSSLPVGARYGALLKHEGVTYVSPNPMEVRLVDWDAMQRSALYVDTLIPGAPVSITLPHKAVSVMLDLLPQGLLTASGYRGSVRIMQQVVGAGQAVIGLSDPHGIETIILESAADLAILEIVLRSSTGLLGDVVYVSFHHRAGEPATLAAPVLEPPVVTAARTGIDVEDILQEDQTNLGLLWSLKEAGGDYLAPNAAVLFHVCRADQGSAAQPDLSAPGVVLNQGAPTLVAGSRLMGGSGARPERYYYTDRHLPDGWYAYQVEGIDLFGRLGEWSSPQTVRVLDRLPPPPPQSVTARYLDPADPNLGKSDKDWVDENGPGLNIRWEWPGILRMQAPDIVPPDAEFRIYSVMGELNVLSGQVSSVSVLGDTSDLSTDLVWSGASDALAGESIRVGGNFFTITGNTNGVNAVIQVKNLTSPSLVPQPGPCTIVFTRERRYWSDYTIPTRWENRLHVEPAAGAPLISGLVVKVEDYTGTQPGPTRTVFTDQPLSDEDGVLTAGALLCEGVVYQAYSHSGRDRLKIHITPQHSPSDVSAVVEPPAGASFAYYPGRMYEVYIAGFELPVDPAKGTAYANLGVSCSDGKPYAADDPVWNQPGRGGLGSRPGNEGPVSLPSKVMVVWRETPAAPANVPAAAGSIFGSPANYYGQARYTLAWEAVSGASGYAVYRCAGSALFDHDRRQRQQRKGYYTAHAVFADDPGFAAWLAEYDSSLTAADLLADPQAHRAAWRAWADRFYPPLSGAEIQDLANRSGNEKAFQRVNKEPVQATRYPDTFDGRGQGVYVYRVRAIDAAGNLGAWSDSYPPVHIFNVTPPAPPVITRIAGGDSQIAIRWAKNPGGGAAGYLVYRTQDKDKAVDWRQMELLKTSETDAYSVEVDADASQKEYEYIDAACLPRQIYFYSVIAAGLDGNGEQLLSAMPAAKGGQAYDLTPPEPPEWVELSRGQVDGKEQITLLWKSTEKLSCLVKKRETGAYIFQSGGEWLDIGVYNEAENTWDYRFVDTHNLRPDQQYVYQLVAKDFAGNQSVSLLSESV